jgi:hypothetical protein
MSKTRTKIVHKPKVKPNFVSGLIIREPSIVVDQNGNIWLVDPFNHVVKQVEVT